MTTPPNPSPPQARAQAPAPHCKPASKSWHHLHTADTLAPKHDLDHSLTQESVGDLQERQAGGWAEGGHRDLFNVLICLSSLSGPHYCPSPRANTWKHRPAGPQYWFMRWSVVAARSRGRRGRTGRRQQWPERVCARRKMLFTQSLPIPQGLMALTKETKERGWF